ncbi:MAG: EI24 domain-containing protein, partial [Bacteroidota bacterium]
MIQGFVRGVLAYGKALGLIRRLRLWFYVFVPGLISLVFGILLFSFVWNFSDNIGEWATSWYRWRGEGIANTVGSVLSGIIVVVLSVPLFKYIIILLVSPFMSLLSEKVEKHLTGDQTTTTFQVGKLLKDIVRGLSLALRNVLWELLLTVLLLLVSLIFPILAPFTAALIFLVQSYYAGAGNMDFTMERHLSFRASIQFVRSNRGLAIGNGAIFLLLFLTGIGFLIAPTLATIAGTVETVRR